MGAGENYATSTYKIHAFKDLQSFQGLKNLWSLPKVTDRINMSHGMYRYVGSFVALGRTTPWCLGGPAESQFCPDPVLEETTQNDHPWGDVLLREEVMCR